MFDNISADKYLFPVSLISKFSSLFLAYGITREKVLSFKLQLHHFQAGKVRSQFSSNGKLGEYFLLCLSFECD